MSVIHNHWLGCLVVLILCAIDTERWVSTRDEGELFGLLAHEMHKAVGLDIDVVKLAQAFEDEL